MDVVVPSTVRPPTLVESARTIAVFRVGVRPSVLLAQLADTARLAVLLRVLDWHVAELRAGYAEG